MTVKTVRASALPTLLDSAPEGIKVLSLDCFDTLIWRNLNAPMDVFADLPLGGNGQMQRGWGESIARQTTVFREGRGEVSLEEIYTEIRPDFSSEEIAALVQAELDTEARHCFAFAPTRDLIVEAKRRGLEVVIVSDTYLTEARLRHLITQVGGEELIGMIDRVFCSLDYGKGKGQGLFKPVIEALGVEPHEILHVGDNPIADRDAGARAGMHVVHLKQFDARTEQRLRMEAGSSAMIEAESRSVQTVLQPHRARLALRDDDDPTYAFGHDVVGPIMHGFAAWLREEADARSALVGKPVKLVFLLRDGYLPGNAFLALYPEWKDRVVMAEVSRFTAQSSSFTSQDEVERYVIPWMMMPQGNSFFGMCSNQLLFDDKEKAALARAPDRKGFLSKVIQPSNLRKILSRSEKFAERLFAHLRSLGVEDGDAVMLVDIGYNGTVQNLIEPVLRKGMNLDVCGRYLVLREAMENNCDKRGLIDARHYDAHALNIPYECIAILEQFCTTSTGSVIDYRMNGSSIRKGAGTKGAQSLHREIAQRACLDFVSHVEQAFVKPPVSRDGEAYRRAAMASLARMLCLPVAEEVAMLESFYHDMNMGTDAVNQIVDVDAAQSSLRRRGMFFAKNAMRVFLPGELQHLGVAPNLSMFSARRFGFDLRKNDFDMGGLTLPVEVIDGAKMSTIETEASVTSDGYYRALIPIKDSRYTVGLWFGRLFDYVQVEEICFLNEKEFAREDVAAVTPIVDGMQEVAAGLYRCDGPQGFMLIPTPPSDEPLMLSVVFRPVVRRGEVEEQRLAA